MATLVSITAAGDTTRLRRYEGLARSNACTHAGSYGSEGVTLANVEYYRERGAQQDIRPRPGRRRAA